MDFASDEPAAALAGPMGENSSPPAPPAPAAPGPYKPPKGFLLVSVVLTDPSDPQPLVTDVLVEVLPRSSFCDLCLAALRDADSAPQAVGEVQAYMYTASGREIEIQNPDSTAADTLRSFPSVTRMCFIIAPHGHGPGTLDGVGLPRSSLMARGARVVPRQRRWPRVARAIIGAAKIVLAVEAAVLLRGALHAAAHHANRALRGGGGGADVASSPWSGSKSGGGSDDSVMGANTEGAMDAVADYVAGRGSLAALQKVDPRVVRTALETMDTEVMEQLNVPNIPETKKAVKELLLQLPPPPAAEPLQGGRPAGAAGAAAAAKAAEEAIPGFGPVKRTVAAEAARGGASGASAGPAAAAAAAAAAGGHHSSKR